MEFYKNLPKSDKMALENSEIVQKIKKIPPMVNFIST